MTIAFTRRSYSRPVARLAVPLLALVVLLAGCGGGGTRKPPLSKQAFAAKANAVCARATTRTGLLARLRALRPPKAYQGLYAQWLKAERDALEADKPPKQTLTSTVPLFDPKVAKVVAAGKIAGYARRMGAQTCAKRAIATMPS
jgi:hypothetical protein